MTRATFCQNLATFDSSLRPLDATLATIKKHFHNVSVAYTERVPGYLLAAADLDVKTPPGFARAVEDGTDPGAGRHGGHAPAAHQPRHQRAPLQRADGHAGHDADARLAKQHGIPVVGVSETMPGRRATYQQWQESQMTNLLHALGK